MTTDEALTRTDASDAVEALGWRYLLGALATTVVVPSLRAAVDVATAAAQACGPDADEHLRLDLRSDRVEVVLQPAAGGRVTARDVRLARRVTDAVRAAGFDVTAHPAGRSVQALEIAIDALEPTAVRPFWKAVLGYVDAPGAAAAGPLADPARQGPQVWFQQMDAPRPQRNRMHIDITVPHDEADRRIRAALAAGGVLVGDAAAPAFRVLADIEGNEVCVSTWQGRDPA